MPWPDLQTLVETIPNMFLIKKRRPVDAQYLFNFMISNCPESYNDFLDIYVFSAYGSVGLEYFFHDSHFWSHTLKKKGPFQFS